MALKNGYIRLWRSLVDWEWYKDWKTTRLFVHLLITANYEDGIWQGIEVKRGQRVTSVAKLSEETGLSSKEIRGILDRLKTTNELAIKTTNKYTLITVEKYEFYQNDIKKRANKTANNGADKGQAEGQQRKKEKNKEYNIEHPANAPSDLDSFFEAIWKLYPNKVGKGQVSQAQKKKLHVIGIAEMTRAIDRYKQEQEKEDWRRYKNGSTFFNSGYVDYLDENYQPEETDKPKSSAKTIEIPDGWGDV